MKSMVWKELRENLKWAVLAWVALMLAEFYALSSGRDNASDSFNSLTLCGASFLMVTSFGCAAIGAGLGVVQILPELKRDRWASLLHRPVSREVIFSGKVVAGLLLYLLMATAALLASMAYVAMPGQFAAPYLPVMALPALSDLGLGVTFYFAALLLCLHKGRWWGSRGAVALSLLPVFALHSTRWGMWAIPLLAAVLYFAAALGAMLSNGRPQTQSRTARAALILVLLLGAFAGVSLLVSAVQWVFQGRQDFNDLKFTRFEIARDGQIFLSTQKGDGSEISVKDMKGNPVTDERYVGNERYENLIQLNYLDFDLKNKFSAQEFYLKMMPRNLRNYVRPVDSSYDAKERWYCLVGENYFVGFDKLSRLCVGICDAEGFKPPGSVPKPFPEKLRTSEFLQSVSKYYWAGSQLYKIDFSERSLKPFFNSGDMRIGGAQSLNDSLAPGKAVQVVVVMDDGIHVFDAQGKEIFKTPFVQEVGTGTIVEIATDEKLSRVFVQYTPAFWFAGPEDVQTKPTVLEVLDGSGKLLQRYEKESNAVAAPGFSWLSQFVVLSRPLLPTALNFAYGKIFLPQDLNFYDGSGLRFSLGMANEGWIVLLLAHAILAAAIFFWSSRSGFVRSGALGWTVFVFCFGVAGVVAFLLAVEWPQRLRCPDCGGLRSVEKDLCPQCHAEWPRPVRDGTEILAKV